ncbi:MULTISPECIES: hypothetical protein [Anaerolinea]|uniref:Hypothetical membrane protein n=1 Tax=Anaerolinea thermophila (strain DSM 14523 / JCM 11388 / NBRC 100420 / UNI-1) TaxID=926569 RepID=E8MY01_ANATU|nr:MULTISPECIES: hypothetical protein [Anaerolinea]BAJ64232.1 hypothetical membrane protein [Anaerolinea thermophila UNI-1]
MEILLTPPVALLIYIGVVLLIVWFGRQLAGIYHRDPLKSQLYASGEEAPTYLAAPGYRPFFLVALFFALLHLGMLVLGLSQFSTASLIYGVGLAIGLLVLLLG